MTRKFRGWGEVAARILASVARSRSELDRGQRASLRHLAKTLPERGMIIADEVGMGKTRIAAVVVRAVAQAGGRVAILIPPNLAPQWQEECRVMGLLAEPPFVRNLANYAEAAAAHRVLLFSHCCRVKGSAFSPKPCQLVVIDEAHRSRGGESGLNHLLRALCGGSAQVRRLALTATPIELEAGQWLQMLERIGVGEEESKKIARVVEDYVEAVADVRAAWSDRGRVTRFRDAARRFEACLGRYLLRRDKRSQDAIQWYKELTGTDFHAYRQLDPITVDTARQAAPWKQAVCAAEALSFAARHTENSWLKRLRLTLASGHGIASLLEQPLLDAEDMGDRAQIEAENEGEQAADSDGLAGPRAPGEHKRAERIQWWWERLSAPFADREAALAGHPAILAAVEYIEQVCRAGEKVLVFGRFKAPLRALARLLNAREMLRCLDEGRPWPQSRLPDTDWNLVKIADRQLHGTRRWKTGEKLEAALREQYRQIRNSRRSRARLLTVLEAGFQDSPDPWAESLLGALRRDMRSRGDGEEFVPLAVGRGIAELLGPEWKKARPGRLSRAFAELMRAVSDQAGKNGADNGPMSPRGAAKCWKNCHARLREEYQGQSGRFARLMDGSTEQPARRVLQLAFNRKQSNPRVLVAQSLVGREGLNLHTACRTVVLLHLEWNPGVVEQQIGRVDRIASLWERMVRKAHKEGAAPADCPRIHVRPVIFQGTYDEKQWSVLVRRWDELRAQLHGLILSPDLADGEPDRAGLIEKINAAAPDFSPGRALRRARH